MIASLGKYLTGLLVVTSSGLGFSQVSDMRLWYNQPARNWNEALPVGNGRMAAMVFGDPTNEHLQLNEGTIWAGEPGNNLPTTDFYSALPKIRGLIFEGKHKEAQDLLMQQIPPNPQGTNYGMPYQPLGDLFINFKNPDSKITDYLRALDLSTAICTSSYRSENVTFKREIFTSFPDDVMVIHFTADKPGKINCTLALKSPHKKTAVYVKDKTLVLSGTSGDHENKKGRVNFEAWLRPILTGGKLLATDSSLVITEATELTLLLSAGTNFKNYKDVGGDAGKIAMDKITIAERRSYHDLQKSHKEYYQKFFNRVSLDLGNSEQSVKPTDVRLREFSGAHDLQLIALYFQYGRYLLISSSQPGSQPATLQGLWNDMLYPPWDSKYTININTEMNYWPAEVTDLPEMHEPLFDMIKDLSVTGKACASKMYNARGWVVHHNTDLWRLTAPADGGFYGMWPMGGAWLTQHIWQHYLFSGDQTFLKKHYDVLKENALFFHDVLQEEPSHNWLVVTPSMSPENAHHPDISIAAGTTMDNQLVYDVFSNFITASAILSLEKVLSDSIAQKLKLLPPMQIGRHGQLQEWLHDWDRPDDDHRHMSHLYGLYPSNQISPHQNPELFAAARKSLEYRGDRSTGWSMGWKVNLWARLRDGNHAYKLIHDQLTPSENNNGGTYSNLLDAHPPFQIDGNFGCTSGITEMLLQSHDGAIHLLPALPDKWQSGKVEGLKARGAFIISMEWNKNKLTTLKIHSQLGGMCRLRFNNTIESKELTRSAGANPNPFFAIAEIKQPLVSPYAPQENYKIAPVFDYDLHTQAGKEYTFKF